MTESAIQVCDVSMSYRAARWFGFARRGAARAPALDGVALEVERGERVAVFGENGAGKTTLLRLIAGVLTPARGRVLVFGDEAGARDAGPRRRIGYVSGDERSFYWRLAARENLRFFAALEDLFGERADAEIDRWLAAVGLGASAHARVAEFSAGMRQRLALARGLIGDPEILLLDEPTRSLDPPGTDAIHDLLRGPLTRGRTLVVATNRFEDAANLCSRAIVLRGGRVVAVEPLAERASAERVAGFVRAHLSAPAAG